MKRGGMIPVGQDGWCLPLGHLSSMCLTGGRVHTALETLHTQSQRNWDELRKVCHTHIHKHRVQCKCRLIKYSHLNRDFKANTHTINLQTVKKK